MQMIDSANAKDLSNGDFTATPSACTVQKIASQRNGKNDLDTDPIKYMLKLIVTTNSEYEGTHFRGYVLHHALEPVCTVVLAELQLRISLSKC